MASPSHEAVFRECVSAFTPMAERIARAYEARQELVDELTQEVFLAVWRSVQNFEGRSSLKTYVGRIAHNVCVSHVRRESKK
ncbi:MAG: sigma-70 family RNA polymerase sigma factor [Myxococcota bacterium]